MERMTVARVTATPMSETDLGEQATAAAVLDPATILLALSIDAEPVGKQRPRMTAAEYDVVAGNRTKRKSAHVYTPKGTAEYQETVGWLLRQQRPVRNDIDDLGVRATFHLPTRQRKDVDNLVKVILDACTGIVWRDDAQVSEINTVVIRGARHPHTDLVVYVARSRRRTCETCGTALTNRQIVNAAIYCSPACYGTSQRRGTYRACAGCGAPVYRPADKAGAKTVHCSEVCRDRSRDMCRECDQPVRGRPHSSFCSSVCSEAWHRRRPLRSEDGGTCSECGSPVSRNAARCRACYHAAIRRGEILTHTPRPHNGFPSGYNACPDCGKPKRATAVRCRTCYLAAADRGEAGSWATHPRGQRLSASR